MFKRGASKRKMLIKIYNNRFFRFALYSINVLYRRMLLQKYSKSIDSKYLKSLQNIHKGQRCFIIGNGPSLMPEDLNKIQDEFSFASNKIYYIFDRTEWRPSYYVSIDNGVIAEELNHIRDIGDYPKFINFKSAKYGRKKKDNIWYICTKGQFHINPYAPQASELSEDASKYVTWVHTVTVTAIEIAIYMGFQEIYLLGVDHNYANKMGKDGKKYRDPTVQADYFTGIQGIGSVAFFNVDAVNYAYELAKKLAEKKDIKIFNATRGGKLEVFERVNFDELMAKKEGERE